jgi:hypothetical protein
MFVERLLSDMADDSTADGSVDSVRVWLVERTYSDDAP